MSHGSPDLDDGYPAEILPQTDLVEAHERQGASTETIAHLHAAQELGLRVAEFLGDADTTPPVLGPQGAAADSWPGRQP